MEEENPINLSFRRTFTEIENVIIGIIDWREEMPRAFKRRVEETWNEVEMRNGPKTNDEKLETRATVGKEE